MWLMQFSKEAGSAVEEYKLRVVYVSPPRHPSPVREGSEEGSSPRASVSENDGTNGTEVPSVCICKICAFGLNSQIVR